MRTDSELIFHICGRSEKPNKSLYPKVESGLWRMLVNCWAEERERPPAQQMIKYLNERYPNITT